MCVTLPQPRTDHTFLSRAFHETIGVTIIGRQKNVNNFFNVI